MKKVVSSLLFFSMMFAASAQVFAEQASDNMEEILNSVKSRIAISSEYDAFVSDSYIDENGTEYTFLWESGEDGNKSVSVTANEKGIISNYQYTDGECSAETPAEKVQSDNLYEIACNYVRQLNPDIYGSLRIETGTDDAYSFDIQRYENDIPVDGNRGYIALSADGGTLKDFYIAYTTGIDFEKADKIISLDAAQKAYSEKIGFSLCYGSKFTDNGIAAVPIYTTDDKYMEYIDAISGNSVKLNDISYEYESSDKQPAVPYSEAQDEYALPQINELKNVFGIYSEKQAETAVRSNRIINVPKDYSLKNINGYKDSDKNCFYPMLFEGAKRGDCIEVMMNAKNGEIVNFGKNQNEGKNTITNERAKSIAKNAIGFLAPKHLNDYVLKDNTQDGVFTFVRNVNGVEFSANRIDIYVDMTNGEIVWYDYSYSNIRFPLLDNVIPADKISKIIFENADFKLEYVLNCSKPGMNRYDKATLVYKFSDSDVNEYDAFSGKAMWYDADESI